MLNKAKCGKIKSYYLRALILAWVSELLPNPVTVIHLLTERCKLDCLRLLISLGKYEPVRLLRVGPRPQNLHKNFVLIEAETQKRDFFIQSKKIPGVDLSNSNYLAYSP